MSGTIGGRTNRGNPREGGDDLPAVPGHKKSRRPGPAGGSIGDKAALARRYCAGFGGFISFHGSLTFGMLSNSTLSSLPFTISVRRM
jgi:hypothetical protein